MTAAGKMRGRTTHRHGHRRTDTSAQPHRHAKRAYLDDVHACDDLCHEVGARVCRLKHFRFATANVAAKPSLVGDKWWAGGGAVRARCVFWYQVNFFLHRDRGRHRHTHMHMRTQTQT